MSSVTVLLSAMGLENADILEKLRINSDVICINQCDSESREYLPDKNCLFISTRERGLSKSRNMAMREAFAAGKDICIFCDNDILYENGYENIIEAAFERNPGSDIIVFFIERPERHEPVLKKEGALDHLHAMKIFSPEIAFRLKSVKEKGLRMDELFGAGAKYGMGEENIFLFDALRKGLKITYVPIRIAGTIENESTWFTGYNETFFRNRGAGFYRMSAACWLPLCLQYAVRKRRLFSENMGSFKALFHMIEGKKMYLKEKRYFIVGDFVTGTGPANATKGLLQAMPGNTLYQKRRSKAMRALEIFRKIRISDGVVFSGHSRQNILGMKYAAKNGVPSVYIMHGAVEYENRINRVPDERMAADEREMMQLADRILAVSETFESWLKENYPEYEGKTGHLTNGVDLGEFYVNYDGFGGLSYVNRKYAGSLSYVNQTEADPSGNYVNQNVSILSVGGGMPRKRIVKLCEAVKLLRERDGLDITLHVAGAEGADSREIDSYPFVKDHGLLSSDKMRELYGQSRIFVQNSIFETFGLAPVEALFNGCDIIISVACGVREVIEGLGEDDLISDPEDPGEIAGKIRKMLDHGNNKRLLSSVNFSDKGWEKRASELCHILKSLEK